MTDLDHSSTRDFSAIAIAHPVTHPRMYAIIFSVIGFLTAIGLVLAVNYPGSSHLSV